MYTACYCFDDEGQYIPGEAEFCCHPPEHDLIARRAGRYDYDLAEPIPCVICGQENVRATMALSCERCSKLLSRSYEPWQSSTRDMAARAALRELLGTTAMPGCAYCGSKGDARYPELDEFCSLCGGLLRDTRHGWFFLPRRMHAARVLLARRSARGQSYGSKATAALIDGVLRTAAG